MLSNTVVLTPILTLGGIGIINTLLSRVIGEDNEVAKLLGTVATLVGFGMVLHLAVDLLNEIVSMLGNLTSIIPF